MMDDKEQLEMMHGMLQAHSEALAIHTKAMDHHCKYLGVDVEEIISMIEPFAEQAKFASSEGPGYLRKGDWRKLRQLYEQLRNRQ